MQPPTPSTPLRTLIRSMGPEGALAILALGHESIRIWREETGRIPRLERPATERGSSPKLVLLGWDAADWRIIQPLMAQGAMPALKRLVEQGVKGAMATLSPPLSPILWTSVATGKRAWQHRVGGFVEVDPTSGALRPIRSYARKSKAVWNILAQNGFKSHVVGWWPSHPADRLPGGVMVSNFYQKESNDLNQWPLPEGAVHPPELEQKMAELRVHPSEISLGMILPFVPTATARDLQEDPVVKNVARFLAHCASIQSAATFLLDRGGSDFSAFYFDAIDHFSHLAMRFHPPRLEGVDADKYEKYRGIVEGAYRFHDMMLEALLAKVGAETHVVLLSDHGFRSEANRPLRLPKEPAAPMHEHRAYGIFAAKGPSFRIAQTLFGARLLDICPSVLHFFGLEIGEDMEGRVLLELFGDQTLPKTVPSWEEIEGESGMHPAMSELEGDSAIEKLGMQQLVELGYVEEPIEGGQREHRETLMREERFNIALSMLEAGRVREAQLEFEALCREDPKAIRYLERNVRSLLAIGRAKAAEKALDTSRESGLSEQIPRIAVLRALVELALGRFEEAEGRFLKLIQEHPQDALITEQIAHIDYRRGRYESALQRFEQVLEIDREDVRGLNGKGRCLVELGRTEEALEPLFDSVELNFKQPAIHRLIGSVLEKQGKFEDAFTAVHLAHKMRPADAGIVEQLRAFAVQLGKSEEAAHWGSILEKLGVAAVAVVCGLPRSGTSLMMQLLVSAGLEPYADHSRAPDEHNPKGYLEHERVKKLRFDRSWVPEARGKVVKVVSGLLCELPLNERYKVVFIHRPLTEVIASQQKMLGKPIERLLRDFPLALAQALDKQQEAALRWCRRNPQVDLLEVEIDRVYSKDESLVEELEQFFGASSFGGPLDPQRFWAPLDLNLRRVAF